MQQRITLVALRMYTTRKKNYNKKIPAAEITTLTTPEVQLLQK
jgi:hypothetical protein